MKLLRRLREDANMTRAEGSRQIGMNASTWGLIENGRFIPYPGQLARMASLLGYQGDPEDLLEEVDPS